MTNSRVLKVKRNSNRSSSQPGPVFDAALRGVMEGDLLTATRLLGIPVTAPRGVPEVLPASFVYPVGTLHADLVLQVGPARLAHVEYQGRDLADIVVRMLGYRWVIMRKYPTAVLSQHVVIIGHGRVKPHVDPVMRQFWRVVNAIFLRIWIREHSWRARAWRRWRSWVVAVRRNVLRPLFGHARSSRTAVGRGPPS
jgi:hypothetical protein